MEEIKKADTQLPTSELEQMLRRLEESNDKQARYAKKQYHMSQITALASIIILSLVIYTSATLIPRVNHLFDNMETIMVHVDAIAGDLSDAKLGQMVTNIDHLVTSSEQGVEDALGQLNSVDIATLNKAVNDLSSIISPLARLFGK